jgi:hypothetical protein
LGGGGGEMFFFFFFFFLTQDLLLEPLHQPFFCEGFFWDRVLWTICLGWLWNLILLISVSWVARITGVCHWCPAERKVFIANTYQVLNLVNICNKNSCYYYSVISGGLGKHLLLPLNICIITNKSLNAPGLQFSLLCNWDDNHLTHF